MEGKTHTGCVSGYMIYIRSVQTHRQTWNFYLRSKAKHSRKHREVTSTLTLLLVDGENSVEHTEVKKTLPQEIIYIICKLQQGHFFVALSKKKIITLSFYWENFHTIFVTGIILLYIISPFIMFCYCNWAGFML